ncbi:MULTISPECIES: sensor histidine kinase [unclassified Streptomyces]|uniref:sensor histidine kinase n=1 Tax=unclassified Streptomyces TaxID=2593676 RepID=UPI00225B8E58|nr:MULTISPECIES: histidine kinase [unclassified Streptomyces]MCX5245582.1 histidine kinase [Streptomyces sp. NBC_00201]
MPASAPRSAWFAWPLRAARALGLVLVIAESLTGHPAPAAEGRGLAIALALSVAALCWALCVFAELLDRRVLTLALGGLAAGGGLLASLQHHGVSLVFGCLAGFMAGYLLELTAALGVTALACLGAACGQLSVGGNTAKLAVSLLLYCWFFFAGRVRDDYSARARQAEQLLEQSARLSIEEARVAALAERARIAREIHDVLAHSMASLSVQLQAASALLDSDGLPKHPDLATASTCVRRAGSLAREGLIETRRAIHALREDHEDDAEQLPALLATLAEDYQDADGSAATLAVTGDVKALPAQAGLALLRTAQEALTNVRKHAPDAPVSITLDYQETETRLTVTNPASDAAAPLADTGAGYGLTGLRERAELAGGQLSAGPLDGGWQLTARIPS